MKHLLLTTTMFFTMATIGMGTPSIAAPYQDPVQSENPGDLGLLGIPQSSKSLDGIRGAGLGLNMINPGALTQNPMVPSPGTVFQNGVTGNAFSGDSGIVNVIQNSGNNVRINSSVHLNLSFIK
ncbi:MAG: hypothetical protein ACYCYP_12445 [Leptospirales bacterium]